MNVKKVLKGNIPNHIAIILDGNGRWAKKRGMPRTYGHQNGIKNLITIARYADKIGVKILTVFAFSTENWNRPSDEIEYLMSAPLEYINENLEKLKNSNVKIKFIGRKDRLPVPTLDSVNKIMLETENNTGLTLNVAFDYGGRYDILEASKIIAGRIVNKDLSVNEITEENFKNELMIDCDVDLLIRTSGELRISNFMLWQAAYSEFYFTKCLWPDFNEKELVKAIASFQKRTRRFGQII